VDRVDAVIRNVESKVDRIIHQLATIQMAKTQRQATMARMLDVFMDPESRIFYKLLLPFVSDLFSLLGCWTSSWIQKVGYPETFVTLLFLIF
jgi:hypothetical protein